MVVVVASDAGRGLIAPRGAGGLRDRRLLENCTVDASIFVKHEACLGVILLSRGGPGV